MKNFLYVLVLFFTGSSLMAQNGLVTGRVVTAEDGSALAGVNVKLKGTTTGTQTTENAFLIAAFLMRMATRPVVAQLVWQPGEATLLTGITLRGELCYQPEANTLLVRVADKCRAYQASQLQGFGLVDVPTGCRSLFAVLDLPQEGPQESIALIFEELVPGATVRVLQLAGHNARRVGRQYGLPATRKADWQTPQPWYIWVDGRFVAPDDFVDTELDNMLMNSPESVQQWAKTKSRPNNPKVLARWLAYYYREMQRANLALSLRYNQYTGQPQFVK